MIRVRIPNDVAPSALHREGNVIKVISAMVPVPSLLKGHAVGGFERVDYAMVKLDNGVVLKVRFDDCELLAY